MFTDESRRNVCERLRQRDLRAFQHLLQPEVFVQAAKHAGVRLGKSALALPTLVWLGLASAFHRTLDFASVLLHALQLLEDLPGWKATALAAARRRARRRAQRRQARGSKRCRDRCRQRASARKSKHNPYGTDPTRVSEEAFVKRRRSMPLGFWVAVLLILAERFERAHGQWIRWKQFRLLALDGTTITLPKWKRLAAGFGVAKNDKGHGSPQARMVMLQFPLVRLPLRYEVSALREGEKTV